jgi:hypothetical protein
VGQTEGADGEFMCVVKCFQANESGAVTPEDLLDQCTAECFQCPSGLPNTETDALIAIIGIDGTGICSEECLPF